MASLYSTAQSGLTPEHLEAMADDLAAALAADNIHDINDSALMLATQARVLDQIFNRFVMVAFSKPNTYPHVDSLRLALLAQRQSASTIDRLKRNDARRQSLDIKKMQNPYKRTE
jgi:hypothetical protein